MQRWPTVHFMLTGRLVALSVEEVERGCAKHGRGLGLMNVTRREISSPATITLNPNKELDG